MTVRRRRSVEVACIVLGLAVLTALPGLSAENVAASRSQEAEARLRRDVNFLASDECEGRGPGTKGIDKAADHIANEFKKAGLKPGNRDGSYFQPFTVTRATLQGTPKLVFKGPRGQTLELKVEQDFEALGLGGGGKVTDAPVVFAGYGVSRLPDKGSKDTLKYDDYEDVDLEGKVVILLRNLPRDSDRDVYAKLKPQAPFTSKLGRAERRKARAVLFVSNTDLARDGDGLMYFDYTAFSEDRGQLPAVHMKRAVPDTLLKGQDKKLSDLEKAIDKELKPHSFDLTGWTVSLDVPLKYGAVPVKNVVGVLEGAGPLANQTVVVGAHYDHLGYGSGSSLGSRTKKAIHHGADDNGSGTTAILELARRFARVPDRQGRRLVFMTFSGEELGLLGSDYYCKHPLFALEDTTAMFNLDMVGRLSRGWSKEKAPTGIWEYKDRLLVEGSNTAKAFDALLDTLNKKHGFGLVKSAKLPPNSDHFSFYKKKIPVLFLWTGYHADYHKPSDTADKINVPGMRRVVDLSEGVVTALATGEKRPEYVKVDTGGSGGRGNGPTLGVVPDYTYKSNDGMLIQGVSEGRPAAKAGMKEGDRIVQVAGKPVKNMTTYMQVMSTQKKGDTIEVLVVREGKNLNIKVKLE